MDSTGKINVELRTIAYYEVEIRRGLGRIRSNSNFFNSVNDGQDLIEEDFLLPECIAVGLSSSKFSADCRLPGWDSESYGYHGDDGGLFHGNGRQISEYGTRFGIGDIVGCGINYKTKTIFFTLTGVHLGDAFHNVSGILYPTVGIDAQVNITFNFGRKPFKFQLNSPETL